MRTKLTFYRQNTGSTLTIILSREETETRISDALSGKIPPSVEKDYPGWKLTHIFLFKSKIMEY